MDRIICKHCGVELDTGMEACPLCKVKVGSEVELSEAETLLVPINQLKHKYNLWMAYGIFSISAMAVCIIINLMIDRSLTWSLYTIGSLTTAFAYYTIYSFLRHFILIWTTSATLFTLGNLLLIDALTNSGLQWFFPLALPLTIVCFIIFGVFHLVVNHVKYHGFNIIGFAILHLSVFSVFVEYFTRSYFKHSTELYWSVLVVAAAIPVSIALLYTHYRLKKGNDLKSFFHI